LSTALDNWKKFQKQIEDSETLWSIASEENDEQVLSDLESELAQLSSDVRGEELKMMLSSDQDPMNAIVNIHAGAGGTEAQDWVEMLLRMYLRWAEKKNFKTSIIDYLPGDEAGVKACLLPLRVSMPMDTQKPKSGFTAW
jgi:peptide chain release factor 2